VKLRREQRVVVSFFGDGATEEGVFAESLNFAALKKLPVLFVCENNRYAIHTHQSRRQANEDICGRVRGYGILAQRVENNDVLALHSLSRRITAEIRAGGGPAFIECMTYRWLEHVGPGEDFALGFREREEASRWKEADPVKRIGAKLDTTARAQLEKEVEAEIAAAFAFADSSPFPEDSELHRHVYLPRADG
jgi:TPP-dependent pyruvate/acetoin dehydrogenase alpha subunit